jgi:hypothetical protein
MVRFHFDVWAADDLNGTALGELTDAEDRSWSRLDQDIGNGQFTINRHSDQYLDGWAAQDNLVRVRIEAEGVNTGPWDYDDPRYVHAFFIENGNDEIVSPEEEGGEEVTRGGRDPVVILRRAVVDYQAEVTASEKYWETALTKGVVTFLERNPGEVLRILLRNAGLRSPNPLAPSSHDFSGDGNSTPGRDSAGELWTDSDANWEIKVGMTHLEVLALFAGAGLQWRMGTDLVLHAYDSMQGSDLSGSITFAKGQYIRESANKKINTRETVSRALVSGKKKDGGFTYEWVDDAAIETEVGRREGFLEYQATPTIARLTKAGERYIASRKAKHDGPSAIGIEDQKAGCPQPFDDFFPGDTVTIDVPGEWDETPAKIAGIACSDDEAGLALFDLLLQESPFASFQLGGETIESNCGKCPPPTPHVPGSQPGDEVPAADEILTICNDIGGVSGDRDATGTTTGFNLVPGEIVTYRITQTEHYACAHTESLYLISANVNHHYYERCPSCVDGGIYGPQGPGGAGPVVSDNGTFVTPSSGPQSTGEIVFQAGTNGYAAPCSPPFTVRDCWTLELWHGDVDLNGTDPVVRPPDTGQPVTGESPSITIGASTTTLTLDWPYAVGSLSIKVDGILISPASYVETTPGSGVVTLSWAIDADETVTVSYQSAT